MKKKGAATTEQIYYNLTHRDIARLPGYSFFRKRRVRLHFVA